MPHNPTPEQLAGIASHEKIREERCKKILEMHKKKQKVKTPEEIKEQEDQEKLKQWLQT
jgi:hypothetical protein